MDRLRDSAGRPQPAARHEFHMSLTPIRGNAANTTPEAIFSS